MANSNNNSVVINVNLDKLPKCTKCEKGELLPLYDTTHTTETIFVKGWVCSNCEYNLVLKSGDLYHMQVHK